MDYDQDPPPPNLLIGHNAAILTPKELIAKKWSGLLKSSLVFDSCQRNYDYKEFCHKLEILNDTQY